MAFSALCVPARLGLGFGFYSHLDLRAQECHCSFFQAMSRLNAHANAHMLLNRLVDFTRKYLIKLMEYLVSFYTTGLSCQLLCR